MAGRPARGHRRLPDLSGPTPWHVVDDLAAAVAVAGEHGEVLVVDLENTLVGYGSTPAERRAAMDGAVAVAAARGRLRLLAFVSNGRFALPSLSHAEMAVLTLSLARKPHVHLAPLRWLRGPLAGAAVYGDQPLTDGMLAHNLGGVWIQPRHAHEPDPSEPWWPRVMRRAGARRGTAHLLRVPEAVPAGGR